tara:strand:+ start:369 stop:1061 length:693 start_codon:yes stop_codon:yes gene_type:complete
MGSINQKVQSIIKLDLRTLEREGRESHEDERERSGIVKAVLSGNVLKLVIKNSQRGTVDSVPLPYGDITYHTHPRGCDSIDDCSLIPPSAGDMRIFAMRKNTQAVASKNFTYILRLKPEYELMESDVQTVFELFALLEKYFDEVDTGSHSDYEELWTNMIVWCQLFNVIRFNNKNCIHSFNSEQISKIIPPHLISLAVPKSNLSKSIKSIGVPPTIVPAMNTFATVAAVA